MSLGRHKIEWDGRVDAWFRRRRDYLSRGPVNSDEPVESITQSGPVKFERAFVCLARDEGRDRGAWFLHRSSRFGRNSGPGL